MMMPTKEYVSHLARKAGDMLLGYFRKDQQLLDMRSTAKEAVTTYDKLVDQLIIADIQEAYPEHSILTEESGHFQRDQDWLWIVDSLDGTGNFANQNPFFAVCIALLHQGQPVLGAVNGPAIDEIYVAEKGNGAYLNGKSISVSSIRDLRRSYVMYCEGADKDRVRTGKFLNAVYPHLTDIRKLGSAGLEAAWVATGRCEAYFTTQIEPWDVAAGVLLVSEAGGRITTFHGNPWKLQKDDLLFSNGVLHEEILALLKECAHERTAS